ATGPPDVERPCEVSLRTWSPESRYSQRTPSGTCPQPSGCVLELSFSLPTLPELLTIWVTYIFLHNSHPIKDLVILTADGRNKSLGPQTVFCDVPLTVRLDWLLAPVESVRIHTIDEKLEVDAALLRSAPSDGRCSRCRPLSYKLSRSPPFHPRGQVVVDGPSRSFVDRSVEPGATYVYQVAVSTTYGDSQPSPPLVYTHGSPYCGDAATHERQGKSTEECDDGNLTDGDGCSSTCHVEASFVC
uniref:Fibronectin type-III domain-containing protein n=1 Tax=Petromyzon marinus TaxID=7757 RepID=S4RQR5_PETMA